VRALLCLSILLAACSGRTADRGPATDTAVASKPTTITGPDAFFLRIPRAGGAARVVAWPNIDSTVWTSTGVVDAPGQVLGFDDDAGIVAMLDAKSRPTLVDFRQGRIDDNIRVGLTAAVSLDGSTIVGVTSKGDVLRRSPADTFRFTPPSPARAVFPLRDGSMLVWTGRDEHSMLLHVRPPAFRIEDSVALGAADLATGTGVGDRLFFALGDRLQALDTRKFTLSPPIPVGGPITDIAVTPSGDRVYVLAMVGQQPTLVTVDRYRWQIASTSPLNARAKELRVDPIGRFVLLRDGKDSITVLGASNDVIGRLRSGWRDDLPQVGPDGSIVTLVGNDVAFMNPATKEQITRVGGGASELWFAFWWTGFRPRAAGLDQPVTFDSAATAVDSVPPATGIVADSAKPPAVPDTTAKPGGFTVSFFTLLSQSRAQTEAAAIVVDSQAAHVETVVRSGIPMYRVILGPYATCAEAQRVAKASGRTNVWIPEGGCDVPPLSDEPLAR
jgi:hypothetical protein